MKISPDSIPNDQLLEMTVVNKLSRWKLLFIFGTVFFGKHTKFKEVKQFQASDFNMVIHDEVLWPCGWRVFLYNRKRYSLFMFS